MITETQKNYTRLALEQATVKISTSTGFKGTGFFISNDGYILTAWHCISETIKLSTAISVETIDRNTFIPQLDKDKSIQDWDIAVLKIDYSSEYCVPLGFITDENRGNEVMAIGYPAGYIEERGIGVYDGNINQLFKHKTDTAEIDAFETNTIEGQGQSGGLIYHYASQRLIGLAKAIYKDDVTKNTGFAVRFEALFERWSELQDINQNVARAWDEYLKKGPKPLNSDKLQALLGQIPKITANVSETEEHDWPLPIYKTIKRLDQNPRTPQNYLMVFEAFIHLHFVNLASQFYWAFNPEHSNNEEVKAGLAVIHESLLDSNCGGCKTWLRRSAILSLACRHLDVALPELVDILEPDTLTLVKQANTNPATQDTQAYFWRIKSGGECWQWLQTLAGLEHELKFYEPLNLDSIDINEIDTQVETLLNTLTTLFKPYQGLQLALVTEKTLEDSQQHQVGVHCYWQDDHFLSTTNKRNKRKMQQIWSQQDDELDLLRAPTPPRPDWQWDESVLLSQPQQPYKKYIYLMPLGYRYHQHDLNQDNPVPGLLDSVRWKQQQVASILQRSYQNQEPPKWEQATEDATFKHQIERLVQELCENFAFKPPLTDTQPVYIPPQFDLQHDHFAALLAENSVARFQEVERVLNMLKTSSTHHLLLEGASGSGKTVLLSQIFLAERQHAVFVSMDAKLEPLLEPQENIETAKANIALRVGMYCLTVLNHLMDLSQPDQVLPLAKIQDAIRDNLAYFANKHPQTHFFIVVDGLNQAIDPGGVLGALPPEVLDNLYILVSSQPQERVRQPLNIYTQKTWQIADIGELAVTEAEAIVWYYWTQTIAEQSTPQRADLPSNLLKSICQASNNLPIFIEEWTKGLRELWAADPYKFANKAEAHFQQYHIQALPEFLRSRLAEVKQDFNPPYLLDAIFWCLSLIKKALTIEELHAAIQTLRQEGLLTKLPAISKLEIEDALRKSRIGGFIQRRKIGLSEGWQLSHEVLGQWFYEHYGQAEKLPSLRLALVSFGAIPLPDTASEAEFEYWLLWVRNEDYDNYQSLAPELQVSVLDSLLAHLSKTENDYTLVLARLAFVLLSATGEQQRSFALESDLNSALEHHNFPARIQAYVLQTLGDIKRKQNQLDEALKYFKRSLKFRKTLLSESAIPQNFYKLVHILNRIGDIYRDQKKIKPALKYFQFSLKSSEQLLSESAIPQYCREVAFTQNRIGVIFSDQDELEKALKYFKSSLKLNEQLLSKSAISQNRRDLALNLNKIGKIYTKQYKIYKALKYFKRSLNLSKQLLSESAIPQNSRDVAFTLNHIGDIYSKQKQTKKALEYLQRSLKYSEQLLSESKIPQNRRDVAFTLSRIGDIYRSQNETDTALEYFKRSLKFREKLFKESATQQNRRDFSYILNYIGDIYRSQGKTETAFEYFDCCLALNEQLLKESDIPQNRRGLAFSLINIGENYNLQNQTETALEYFERSLVLSEQLLKESAIPQNRHGIALTLMRIGDIYSDNQPDKALEYYERSHSFLKQLQEESPIPQVVDDMQAISDRLKAIQHK